MDSKMVWPRATSKTIRQAAMLAGALQAAATAMPAMAQVYITNPVDPIVPVTYNRDRNQSVTELPRPEFDAKGIPLGSFLLLPSLGTSLGYTTNVYQAGGTPQKDVFSRITPQAMVVSNWSRHSLQFIANGAFNNYASHGSRNETGWGAEGRGRYDISSDFSLNASGRVSQLYENTLFSGALTNIATSVPYLLAQGKMLADMRLSRVRVVATGDYSSYKFENVTDLSGVVQSQAYRDRQIKRGAVQTEYALRPDMGAFVQATVTGTDYTHTLTDGSANRSSTELRIIGGATMDLTSLLRGSLGIGYLSRNYQAPIYRDISGVSYDAKLEYFPTVGTSVTAAASRSVLDANTLAVGGYFANIYTLKADHELRKNLLAYAGGSYERDSFSNSPYSVDVFSGAIGASYLLNRFFKVSLDVNYSERHPSFPGSLPTKEFRPILGVTTHL